MAFAFNQSNDLSKTAAPDSCAMKAVNVVYAGESQTKTSCCDKEDCCCKSGTCPMKKQGGEAGSENCCSNCCGDACPMKNKQAQNVIISSGESCDKMRS